MLLFAGSHTSVEEPDFKEIGREEDLLNRLESSRYLRKFEVFFLLLFTEIVIKYLRNSPRPTQFIHKYKVMNPFRSLIPDIVAFYVPFCQVIKKERRKREVTGFCMI